MDQGTAAVIAAGLGIAGTLGGALGGAWFFQHTALRQVAAQEQADLRTRLRDERRVAFAEVLTATDAVGTAMSAVIVARVAPDADTRTDWRDVWLPVNEALNRSMSAVNALLITGPQEAYEFALAMHQARELAASAWRSQRPFDEATAEFAQATTEVERARASFLAAAREAMAATGS